MVRPLPLALVFLAGVLLPAAAGAADERPCSIKRVELTSSGVNVYFTVRRQVMLMHEQEGDLMWIDAGAPEQTAADQKTLHALPLAAGEEAVVRNPTERCSLVLGRRNGKVGIDVEVSALAKSKTAPRGPDTHGKFLPAE
jgi:hypothetical protein